MAPVLRLLHVEDSQDDVDLIRLELEKAGYELHCRRVETATDMADALASERWDVIVSDFKLPVFDAYGALATLTASGLDIPFILVSGCIGEEAAVAMMKAGADDFVMKDRLARFAPAIERAMKDYELRHERKRAEDARNVSEKLLRDISSALGEGLLVQDSTGRLVFMNPEAERLLGWSEQELAARDIHETIHYLHPDGRHSPRTDCPIFNLPRTGTRYRSDDDVFIRKEGVPFPVHYVSTVITQNGCADAIVIAFTDITERKQTEQELKASRQQLQELSTFLQTVREEERKRIARELHDELGQSLTALRMDVNWLAARPDYVAPGIADRLRGMESLIHQTVESMRRISEDLRPGMLDDLGLSAALEHHVERFIENAGIPCALNLGQEEFEVGDQVATALFRIVQESLTNVARHSGATLVNIHVEDSGSEILLSVQDNGCGLVMGPSTGHNKRYGIMGMRERVKMLGGHFEIIGTPDAGTRVEVRIPYQSEAVEE